MVLYLIELYTMAKCVGIEPTLRGLESLVLPLHQHDVLGERIELPLAACKTAALPLDEPSIVGELTDGRNVRVPASTAWLPGSPYKVRMAGFAPAFSRFQGERITKLSHILSLGRSLGLRVEFGACGILSAALATGVLSRTAIVHLVRFELTLSSF
jgi:hypothetical protein